MKKTHYANTYESIFESHDILGNPFMEYTKRELETAFLAHKSLYDQSSLGSAPRRQAFNALAQIEIAFDAYGQAIKQFDVFVDEDTSLRHVLEDSYEIGNGTYKTIEDMRREVGLPGVVVASGELLGTTVEVTKDLTKKASNGLFNGIFHASSWLRTKTDPANRK